MVAPIPAKRGRKPAVATAPATGQVQSLTRGLKLLEWMALLQIVGGDKLIIPFC